MDNQFGLKTGLNTGFNVGTGYNTGFHYVGATPNETLNNINSWQKETKKKYNDAKNQEIAANAQKMFECSVSTDDGQVSKMNLSGANLNNMALLIKQWSNENGYHSYDDISDPGEVVCRYLNKNPHRFQVTQDTLNNKISLDDWSSITKIGQKKYTPITTDNVPSSQEDSNVGVNIAQSLIDIPMNLAKLPFNLADKGTAWLAKQFSDDDEAIDQKLQENLQRTENFATLPGVNREDLSYQIPNIVGDLGVTVATSFIPGVGEAKWAEWAAKYPAVAKLIKSYGSVEKLVKKYPKLKPFLEGGKLGVKDTTVMNALEGEGTTPLEALEGWLAGGVVEKGLKSFKGLSALIQTNGLLTPTKAERIVQRLKDIGNKAPGEGTIEDLADFMTKHGLNGTKKQIIEKSRKLGSDKKIILDELLSKSTSTHDLKEADEALELLIKIEEGTLENAPKIPREGDIAELKSLLEKSGNYSLSDLEVIKMKIDKLLNLYSSKTNAPLENKTASLWRETRKKIQLYIEDAAKKEKLGDVSMLNNEIQTAYAIADGVAEKSLKDTFNSVGDFMWSYSIPGLGGLAGYGAVKDLMDGDIEGAIEKGLGALLLNNTFFKSHLGSLLNRMTGTTRYEIQQWIDTEGKKALSESANKELGDIIKGDETMINWLKEFVKQYTTQLPKESAIVGTQKLGEGLVDKYTE